MPLAGVQKINHWSHKKGLPHVTWHRRIPEVQNPVCIHLLQGDETLEQCTQLPFLITANSSLMSHNECIFGLYFIIWYGMLHWCFSGFFQARGSYFKRSIFTSISSPKVTYFGWIFLELQTNQGKHSVWHPFGLGVLWKSRLPLTLEIWSHRPLGEILD